MAIDWSQYEVQEPMQGQETDWSQYAIESPETQGWSGVGQDILSKAGNFAGDVYGTLTDPSKMYQLASALGSEAYGVPGQFFQPKMGAGFIPYLQPQSRGIRNIAASGVNALAGIYNAPQNIGDYLSKKGIINPEYQHMEKIKIPSDLGETIFGLKEEKPGDKMIRAISELIPYFKGASQIPGLSPLAKETAALTTHAIGKNEDPIRAALTPIVARSGLSAVQAPFKLAKGTYDAYKGFAKAINPKYTAKDILTDLNKNTKAYTGPKGYYETFLKDTEIANTPPVSIPDLESFNKIIRTDTHGKVSAAFENFSKNQNVRNAHKLLSKMKELQRNYKNKSEKGTINHRQDVAYAELNKMIPELTKSMEKSLGASDNPALAKLYPEINEGYNRDVLTYKHNPDIKKYKAGKLKPENLIKALNQPKNDYFTIQKGELYPGIEAYPKYKTFAKALKKGAAEAVGLGGALKFMGF